MSSAPEPWRFDAEHLADLADLCRQVAAAARDAQSAAFPDGRPAPHTPEHDAWLLIGSVGCSATGLGAWAATTARRVPLPPGA